MTLKMRSLGIMSCSMKASNRAHLNLKSGSMPCLLKEKTLLKVIN